jgi:hypothetical protein
MRDLKGHNQWDKSAYIMGYAKIIWAYQTSFFQRSSLQVVARVSKSRGVIKTCYKDWSFENKVHEGGPMFPYQVRMHVSNTKELHNVFMLQEKSSKWDSNESKIDKEGIFELRNQDGIS